MPVCWLCAWLCGGCVVAAWDVQAGFPGAVDRGGVSRSTAASEIAPVVLPANIVPGSVSLSAVAYATPVGSLMQALEALIREPCGCFEQTSATTYPLVMAQQYFKVRVHVLCSMLLRVLDVKRRCGVVVA